VCHIQQAIAPRAPAILLVLAAATKDPTATPRTAFDACPRRS